MYERQHLRELEALRPDVKSADQKHIPQKPVTAPRPSYIPPLEDFAPKPSIPRPSSGPPTNVPRAAPPSVPPLSASAFINGPSQNPLASAGAPSPAPSSLPPQSPGAGPSSARTPSHTSFAPPLMDGPPLGGRFVDGTKSMFVKTPTSPLASSTIPTSASTSGLPAAPQSPAPQAAPRTPADPLSATSTGPPSGLPSAAPHPLAASAYTPSSQFANGARSNSVSSGTLTNDLDPLGMAKPVNMSASVRVQPTRPRLDAREAASKLANMF